MLLNKLIIYKICILKIISENTCAHTHIQTDIELHLNVYKEALVKKLKYCFRNKTYSILLWEGKIIHLIFQMLIFYKLLHFVENTFVFFSLLVIYKKL